MTLLQIPLVITSVSWNLNKATCTHTPAFTFKHAYLYLHQYGVHGEHQSPERGRWIKKKWNKIIIKCSETQKLQAFLALHWFLCDAHVHSLRMEFSRLFNHTAEFHSIWRYDELCLQLKRLQRNAESKRKFKRRMPHLLSRRGDACDSSLSQWMLMRP